MNSNSKSITQTPERSRPKQKTFRKLQNQENAFEISTKLLFFADPDENFPFYHQRLCTSKLKKLEKRSARISQGLSPEPDSLSDRSLGLLYQPFPKIKTKTELNQSRKEILTDKDFASSLLGNMSTREQRLLKREEKFHNFSSGKTLAELIKERKEKDKEYNSKIFGNVVIGIHGKELPKFGQYNKIY